MDFGSMLPLLMGMMGGNGGGSGGNGGNMSNIMSMLGNMNGGNGGGAGGMDMGMLMNMMKNFQGGGGQKPREEERRQEPEHEEYRPRQAEAPPSYKTEEPEEPRQKTTVNRFFESNGIRNFEPVFFDEQKKQQSRRPQSENGNGNGSRPIKNIANDDVSRKIDGYFSKD